MPTPGGDEIDSQLIGPGVPSSINVSLEGPALKRRGSTAETQRVAQVNIFDRRHSMDARATTGGSQWWGGERRDSTSSMFSSPSVSYGSPAYSADSSHGHPPGPFAWHSTQPADQAPTAQSEGDGSGPARSFDPNSVPPIAMVPPVSFSADRRMSVPTNLPSTMSSGSTVSRVLRSRSRPPSVGRGRIVETSNADSTTSQPGPEAESGSAAAASSSSAVLSASATRDAGLTPYSRSPELRVSHKLAERKRRKEMKDLFDELRDQLPADRGMKASKWEILSKAIDFIVQLKQTHQDMTREIDMLRHEMESVRTGVPSFGPGGPHPGMYATGPPGVVPYAPPAGHALSSHQPPQVSNHQTAAAAQSDSRPGSSHNAFNPAPAPQNGSSGATSGPRPETPST
ncbi:hypothetical protein BC834DRAFT_613967 [Gloeopeniophorella convolvens]|nr:hypothetical protein BC834DRAFT_613967 [Gloeopeniophorella convolvens]